ncbi:SDR family NAD(P)-dependent oxidoreductase [Mucilaginibacter sp. OK098]|uniref:SDR family NAD(P)-dependent oxidoreductase n=1 Tax=Mucilaginibacter sp. OK098 TaxID=1855297 RepID=UPI000921042C|nr:SDR family oxidoreductase [Mucilaginibacter sp. OK098]SHN21734.1 NAD(P)-dependent dehydrogenase, short-chain alcohol dehydrogenase family [Mucilaginibacter sp. OK098]
MYNNYYRDKVVLVTGGGSGMGRGLCEGLAECGAIVTCTDINLKNIEETVKLIGKSNVKARKLDVTQLADFEETIADIVKENGRIDLIFNNAGIGISGELRDLSIEHWKKVLDINFYGVLYGSQTAYLQMLKQGFGQIVNTASLAGLLDMIPLIGPYSVSKHAVLNYTRVLRYEARAFNIKANTVCPGYINTSIIDALPAVNSKSGWNREAIKQFEPGLPVSKAVEYILKGVARNKEVILFPRVARLILHFSRLFKGLYLKASDKSLKDFREKFRLN